MSGRPNGAQNLRLRSGATARCERASSGSSKPLNPCEPTPRCSIPLRSTQVAYSKREQRPSLWLLILPRSSSHQGYKRKWGMSKTSLSTSCLRRDTGLGVRIPVVSHAQRGVPDPQHSQFQRPPRTSSPAQSRWGPQLLAQSINPSLKAFGWSLQCSTTQSLNPQGRFSSSSMIRSCQSFHWERE